MRHFWFLGLLGLSTIAAGCFAASSTRIRRAEPTETQTGRLPVESQQAAPVRGGATLLVCHDSTGAATLLSTLEKAAMERSSGAKARLASLDALPAALSESEWDQILVFATTGAVLESITPALIRYAETFPESRVELYLWPEESDRPHASMLTPVAGVYWYRGCTTAVAAPRFDPERVSSALDGAVMPESVVGKQQPTPGTDTAARTFGGALAGGIIQRGGMEVFFAKRITLPSFNLKVRRLGVPGVLDQADAEQLLRITGTQKSGTRAGPDPACIRDCVQRYRNAIFDCRDQLDDDLTTCQELYGPDPNDPLGDPVALAECERAATTLFWVCRLGAQFRLYNCLRACGWRPKQRPSSPHGQPDTTPTPVD